MNHKKLVTIICFLILLGSFHSCGITDNTEPKPSDTSSVSMEDGTFPFEVIETNIYIKGHRFTIPQKLSELEDGLTYEFIGEEFGDGLYEVEISDEHGVILRSIAENAHRKSNKASLYNISLTDSDSDVLGITPLVSTKKDVLRQFGEPTETKQSDLVGKQIEAYIYGFRGESSGFQTEGKFMNIAFNEDDVVVSIVINYTE